VSFDATTTSENDRSYATFQHVVPLIAHLGGPIVVPIIAAVIMWQIKKEQPFLDDHGREAANFQISLALYTLVIIPLLAVVTCGIGAVLYIPLIVLNIYGSVRAAMAANKGEYVRYPMCLRLV
jgi:hypothetical protein